MNCYGMLWNIMECYIIIFFKILLFLSSSKKSEKYLMYINIYSPLYYTYI